MQLVGSIITSHYTPLVFLMKFLTSYPFYSSASRPLLFYQMPLPLKYVLQFQLKYIGQILSYIFMIRPDFGIDDIHFPKLPEIHSPAVKLQVFTHRSYHARPTHVFEDHPLDPSHDNEK